MASEYDAWAKGRALAELPRDPMSTAFYDAAIAALQEAYAAGRAAGLEEAAGAVGDMPGINDARTVTRAMSAIRALAKGGE